MSNRKAVVIGRILPEHEAHLVLAHRLMAACEGILCPVRCLNRLPRGSVLSPQDEADLYYLLFAALAAAGEVSALVSEEKTRRLLAAEMFNGDQDAQASLALLQARPYSDVVQMARRARDKYWAHWDDDISQGFVKTLKGDKSDTPFAETSGNGEVGTTASPWVRQAWFIDLEKQWGPKVGMELDKWTHQQTHFFQSTAMFARVAATRLIKRCGLVFASH